MGYRFALRVSAALAAMGLACAGCQSQASMRMSPEKISAAQDAECRSWGAKPGTDAYVRCRAALIEEQDRRRQMAAAFLLSRGAPGPSPAYRMQTNRSVMCNSLAAGATITTNCF